MPSDYLSKAIKETWKYQEDETQWYIPNADKRKFNYTDRESGEVLTYEQMEAKMAKEIETKTIIKRIPLPIQRKQILTFKGHFRFLDVIGTPLGCDIIVMTDEPVVPGEALTGQEQDYIVYIYTEGSHIDKGSSYDPGRRVAFEKHFFFNDKIHYLVF